MRPWVGVVAITLVVAHLTLRVGFGIGATAPDLMLLAMLVVARRFPIGTAAGVGLLLGLIEDALAVLSFGAGAFTFALIGAVAAATRELFVGDSPWFGVSYLFLGKLSRDTLHWVLMGTDLREPFLRTVVLEGGLAALYLAVVGTLVVTLTGLRWDGAGASRR
ncbi:MAG: rod shape-determining protein MreD [Longimicrobiales bacterium]|nr:rod shape-determining protein MreD [Longimicrobiales bacterium]